MISLSFLSSWSAGGIGVRPDALASHDGGEPGESTDRPGVVTPG